MSIIYLNEKYDRLKNYTASVKGGKSIVTIHIEVSEPGALGYLLQELSDIEREQLQRDKQEKEAARASKARKPLALPAPALQLQYFGGDDE